VPAQTGVAQDSGLCYTVVMQRVASQKNPERQRITRQVLRSYVAQSLDDKDLIALI
jgi:hypothetical protein